MIKEKDNMTYRIRTAFMRIAAVLLLIMVTVVLVSPASVYAAKGKEKEKEVKEQEEPIREVHDVGIGSEMYCFFVTHNVVLTPAEVAEMTDEDLTATILERSGLYIKKTNCKKASHKEITIKDWAKKKKGDLLLSESDIEGIRMAEPVDGEPVKFYMDLMIVQKTGEVFINEEGEEEEEVILYSTFKRTSPRLLFAVVATEEDAKYGEDICQEEKKPEQKKKQKTKKVSSKPEAPEEELLPEFRTINMADRSGEPIEETLKDGSPVDLEWIEPKDTGKDEKSSFIDRIPGGMTGLAVMAAAAAAAIFAVIAAKRKKTDE